ncbi:MAG: polysaccharide biosynthesis protein [Clostridia bacterium]|nr:polysaccharide biosynthesis protein [Clostridia bacterium]
MVVSVLFLWVYQGAEKLSIAATLMQGALGGVCFLITRALASVYRQMWRYGGVQAYIRLLFADTCAFLIYWDLSLIFSWLFGMHRLTFLRLLSLFSLITLTALTMRLLYRYVYKCRAKDTLIIRVLCHVAFLLTGRRIELEPDEITNDHKIKIAIVGAGRVGVGLASDLMSNPHASYYPTCFIDINPEKIGSWFLGLPVLDEGSITSEDMHRYGIQEVILALPQLEAEQKHALYERYRQYGCRVKVYDYPTMRTADSSKRVLREFDLEELLFRKPIILQNEKLTEYYRDKVVLITGGGGSIGSEMCRQIARMHPRRLVILDVYENGAYDVQQELRIAYGKDLDVRVEIVSVCDEVGMRRVFEAHRPQIVIAAAAHKHVPLMEHNCCEAVSNNVFGTLNTVRMTEEFRAERFIMVSTDKAVNPTNVMGATKRMCEIIVQSRRNNPAGTVYSATRFGNVLGSAGSVVPLFKRQIASGGPVTITDKRIIRYFMTIPEASQLVLQSALMAKSGELFVLDMGQPVKILELAENLIRLSDMEPYKDIDIVETGLRPGEKLYEELLIQSETLRKTENSMIFIEEDEPLPEAEVQARLQLLREALSTGDDNEVRLALHKAVPTFLDPKTVNATAEAAQEMKWAKTHAPLHVAAPSTV